MNNAEEYSPAVEYLTNEYKARMSCREKWMKHKGGNDLRDAHQFALSSIYSAMKRYFNIKFDEQSKAIEGRMALTAQFVQGVDGCECAITEGLYIQAAALLRQELETIEDVNELEKGKRKDGKTPQLDRLKDFGRVYGFLSNLTHVSVHKELEGVITIKEGSLIGPSIYPFFQEELAEWLYGIHVFFIVEIGRQISTLLDELYGEGFNKKELQYTCYAINILQKEDFIK
jgi:hypothetical protein